MLVAKEQVHQAYLVEHFSIFDAWRMSGRRRDCRAAPAFHLLQAGSPKQGLAMVYGMVQKQAAVLAFNDIYRMLSILAVAILPVYLVVRKAPMSTARRVTDQYKVKGRRGNATGAPSRHCQLEPCCGKMM